MKRFSFLIAFALSLAPLIPVNATTLAPGMLIKASGPAIYYYSDKDTRMVFPNEKTYLSWYSNFNAVVTIPDTQLSSVPLGGNVTYRPGSFLVKITTDPKVYAIDVDGSLRWVRTEAVAKELYGADWAKSVRDIPDAFFSDYGEGPAIISAADFNPRAAMAARNSIISGVYTPVNNANY